MTITDETPAVDETYLSGRAPQSYDFQDIIYEKKDWVARVTMNRPDHYNAYSTAMLGEMLDAFRDAAFDDAVAVLVLTGAGD